jgi:dihydroorotate dehydrogenase (fumarate)
MSERRQNLRTTYLGLELTSPLVVSAGPLTREVDLIVELERAGAGAVVLPSLFEEQIEHETSEIDRILASARDGFLAASVAPPHLDDYNHGLDRYLELIEEAKSSVDIPVIASLNGANIGGWLRFAHLIEDAGADALEINLFTVAADPIVSGATLESEQFGLVALLAAELGIPLAVKISPFYSSLASFVAGLQEAGAAGVTMFNRFYLPDMDPESLGTIPHLTLSIPEDSRLPLRWTSIMRRHLTMSIAASSGVHSGFDAAKLILAGADVVMMTSSLLRYGVGHLRDVESQLRAWMDQHDHDSVTAMRSTACHGDLDDPTAYERAHYIAAVTGHTSRFDEARHAT